MNAILHCQTVQIAVNTGSILTKKNKKAAALYKNIRGSPFLN